VTAAPNKISLVVITFTPHHRSSTTASLLIIHKITIPHLFSIIFCQFNEYIPFFPIIEDKKKSKIPIKPKKNEK